MPFPRSVRWNSYRWHNNFQIRKHHSGNFRERFPPLRPFHGLKRKNSNLNLINVRVTRAHIFANQSVFECWVFLRALALSLGFFITLICIEGAHIVVNHYSLRKSTASVLSRVAIDFFLSRRNRHPFRRHQANEVRHYVCARFACRERAQWTDIRLIRAFGIGNMWIIWHLCNGYWTIKLRNL